MTLLLATPCPEINHYLCSPCAEITPPLVNAPLLLYSFLPVKESINLFNSCKFYNANETFNRVQNLLISH